MSIILYDELKFDIYWKSRIEKPRRLIGAINSLGTSQCSMSANSKQSAYTGMISAVTTWGVEIGWRGQKEWEKAIIKLQYQALRKATGTVLGSRASKVDKIIVVESVPTLMVSTQARLIAKSMEDPTKVGDL